MDENLTIILVLKLLVCFKLIIFIQGMIFVKSFVILILMLCATSEEAEKIETEKRPSEPVRRAKPKICMVPKKRKGNNCTGKRETTKKSSEEKEIPKSPHIVKIKLK